jgi:glycosidase
MAERRPPVQAFYSALAKLRRTHPAFTRGEVHWLSNADETRVLSFERTHGDDSLIVVINLSSVPFAGVVDAGTGAFLDITPQWQTAEQVGGARRTAALPALYLAPWDFRVFKRER